MWHRLALLLGLIAVVGVGQWPAATLHPEARVAPCRHPIGLSLDGSSVVVTCGSSRGMHLVDLLRSQGVSRCLGAVPPREVPPGRVVYLGADCRVSHRALAPRERMVLGLTFDLNRARAEDLQLVPGIGPALARRIIDDRRARGPLQSVDQLRRVRGVGPVTVERMRAVVHVASPGRAFDRRVDCLSSARSASGLQFDRGDPLLPRWVGPECKRDVETQ